jgi:hypothetical protein
MSEHQSRVLPAISSLCQKIEPAINVGEPLQLQFSFQISIAGRVATFLDTPRVLAVGAASFGWLVIRVLHLSKARILLHGFSHDVFAINLPRYLYLQRLWGFYAGKCYWV